MNKLDFVVGTTIKGFLITTTLAFLLFTLLKSNLNWVLVSDYRNFATGASIISSGKGRNLYRLDTQKEYQKKLFDPHLKIDTFLPYLNLPFFALAFIPLLDLHPMVAYRLIVLINLLLILAIVVTAPKIFPKLKSLLIWPYLIALFLPFFYSMLWAQVSPLIILIILLVYENFRKKSFYKAGLWAGLILVKVQFLVILPFLYLLCKDRKKFVLGFCQVFGIIMFINILVSGMGFFFDYFRLLIQTNDSIYQNRPWQKYTLVASLDSLNMFTSEYSLLQYFINLGLYLVVLGLFRKATRRGLFSKLFASAIVFSVVFAVHVFGHDYGIVLVPILILLNQSVTVKSKEILDDKILLVAFLFFLPLLTLLGSTSVASLCLMLIGTYLLYQAVFVESTEKNLELDKSK